MKPLYVPILRAKKGEFAAVRNLYGQSARHLLPVFDVPTNKAGNSAIEHLTQVTDELSDAWGNAPMLLDTFSWSPGTCIENGEHHVVYTANRLASLGVNVGLIAGYDRWDDKSYSEAIVDLHLNQGYEVTLRIDFDGIEDTNDKEYFEGRVKKIYEQTKQDPAKSMALVDFGDMAQISVPDAIALAESCVFILKSIGFRKIVILGSSMPANIALAVTKVDSSGYLIRKEFLTWRALLAEHRQLIFGDYGIRNPRAAENIIVPDTNGKIRYTTDKRHFIARGHSLRKSNKGAQYYDLARTILESEHYMGETFSWGDQQIAACANEHFKGNGATWIAIDSNHHMVSVLAEVFEATHGAGEIA